MAGITAKEIAERTGLTPRQIQYQIKSGGLNATWDASVLPGKWVISEADFLLWQATRRKVGRPRLMNRDA